MVVKEILLNPQILENFDYKRNGKDTITFLKMESRKILREIEKANQLNKIELKVDLEFKLQIVNLTLEQLITKYNRQEGLGFQGNSAARKAR